MLAIIGCGNPNRQDDGFGSVVLGRLREIAQQSSSLQNFWRDVKLFDAALDGTAVMFFARGASALILIDAHRSGLAPGTITELSGDERTQAREPGFASQDCRWEQALDAGRKIHGDEFPRDVAVFLVEAERLGKGLELSPAVAGSVEPAITRIVARIEAFCAGAYRSKEAESA